MLASCALPKDTVSSIQFDSLSCDEVLVLQSELRARYHRDPRPKGGQRPLGALAIFRGVTTIGQREEIEAYAQIDALQLSYERRKCGKV